MTRRPPGPSSFLIALIVMLRGLEPSQYALSVKAVRRSFSMASLALEINSRRKTSLLDLQYQYKQYESFYRPVGVETTSRVMLGTDSWSHSYRLTCWWRSCAYALHRSRRHKTVSIFLNGLISSKHLIIMFLLSTISGGQILSRDQVGRNESERQDTQEWANESHGGGFDCSSQTELNDRERTAGSSSMLSGLYVGNLAGTDCLNYGKGSEDTSTNHIRWPRDNRNSLEIIPLRSYIRLIDYFMSTTRAACLSCAPTCLEQTVETGSPLKKHCQIASTMARVKHIRTRNHRSLCSGTWSNIRYRLSFYNRWLV